MRTVLKITWSLIFALTLAGGLNAQDDGPNPNVDLGLKPYQSLHGGDIDTVSMSDGNLIVHIPLVNFPQRGELRLGLSLVYNNRIFAVSKTCTTNRNGGTTCTKSWSLINTGWSGEIDGILRPGCVGAVGIGGYSKYQFSECSILNPDGGVTRTGLSSSGVWRALDGSGSEIVWNGVLPLNQNIVAIDKGGVRYTNVYYPSSPSVGSPLYQVEDPNGNMMDLNNGNGQWPFPNTIIDSLDRNIPSTTSTTDYGGCTGPLAIASAVQWLPPGYAGGTYPIKICYANVAVSTPAAFSSAAKAYSGVARMIQSVVLPNQTAWTLEYDGNGDLTEIVLPTGGTISYTWNSASQCPLIPGSIQNTSLSQVLASRTLNANDGQGAHTWTYAFGPVVTTTNPASRTITVTDPLGNDTVHTETGLGNTCSFYETSKVQYQGAQSLGNVVQSVATTYTYSPNSQGYYSQLAPYSVFNVLPTSTTTTVSNGKQSKVAYQYDSGFTYEDPINSSWPPTQYSANYGLLLAKSEYDYGSGAPGSLLKTTTTGYLALSNSAYLTNNLLSLPSSVQITDGGGTQRALTTYGYDAGTPASSGISTEHDSAPPDGNSRGNQTSVDRWLSTTGANLTSSAAYFDTGDVQTATDPKGNKTTYAYSSTYDGAYPTMVTNALGQITQHAYDFNTGLVTSTTDPNSQTTSFAYDDMLRPASVTYPDGGQEIITRQETTFPFTATLTKAIITTPVVNYVTTNTFDGLGRVTESLVTDPQANIETDITYDADGRKSTVSNPYRLTTDSTYGITTYQYDALNRTTLVIPPDGTASSDNTSIKYCGSSTLVTDQAGHWRRSTADGLGRLVEVDEPNSATATVAACPASGDPTWVTTYSYDALNDLTNVVQGGSHNRSFVYDSLKRLTSSTNPEAGTVTYTYDADGNVLTKTDARSITITYGYDVLNRMTGKTYSNGDPAVTYTYDQSACLGQSACYNTGRRTSMTDASGSESWAYDEMGRELAEQRITNSLTKSTAYTYNLDGTLATLTYPSGRIITYTTDPVERPSEVADVANGINYALGTCSDGTDSDGVCYAPQGAVALIDNGASLATTTIYNDRLQPCWIYSTTGTALAKTTTCTATATAATVLDLKYNFSLGTADNGNVMGITNDIDNTRSQTFTYDQVNRIVTARTSSAWSQSFTYDQWANLISAAATGTAPPLSLSVNANNQITTTGFHYDAAANETSDVTSSYVWNAESELKTAASVNYTYDGDGDRVEKSNGALYWYGAGSQVLMETDLSGNLTSEYVYLGGKRVARRDAGNNIYYYTEDILGSSRSLVTSAGTKCYDADFYPFGGEHVTTNTCPQNYKFDGKERDAETSNDDFGARYYSSTYGRFLSADWSAIPAPVPYANLSNPQTLNLYATVSDNPETFADLDGHCEGENGAQPGQTSCGNSPTPATDQAKRNAAVQVAKDTIVGAAKETANTVIGLANLVNAPIDAALANFGINFSFGQGKDLEASTPGEKGAMIGTSLGLLLVPGAGEEKAATKIGTITADAEKLYPKLAGKFQEHHIIPQYLGGATDGATARIPAAYHQLITNEFRALAPYGQKIQRTAEEVGRILQQVYSKYPLP
jgi:RHS repeat-associated protein